MEKQPSLPKKIRRALSTQEEKSEKNADMRRLFYAKKKEGGRAEEENVSRSIIWVRKGLIFFAPYAVKRNYKVNEKGMGVRLMGRGKPVRG